jgi:hypothetical protein
MTTPSDAAPEQAAQPEQPEQAAQAAQPGQTDGATRGGEEAAPEPSGAALSSPAPPLPSVPILPAQSREDTDVGWGDYAERDDDDRLLRDRPPHWGTG